jgi:hypothetical protein
MASGSCDCPWIGGRPSRIVSSTISRARSTAAPMTNGASSIVCVCSFR